MTADLNIYIFKTAQFNINIKSAYRDRRYGKPI